MSLLNRFALLLLSASCMSHAAEPLTIDRLFADPSLNGAAPRALQVAPDGARVTFLRGKADNQNQLDLWEFSIAAKQTRLLVDSGLLIEGEEKLSAEEQARRERQRTASLSGILEYQFAPDGKRILFPFNGDLYLYDLSKQGKAALRQLTHGEGFVTDAKVSPRGGYVSFVRDAEVWVLDLTTSQARAVTHGAGGSISHGMAEFVAQEEMDRATGYWWAPDDSALAFTEVDESSVPVQRRFEINADRTEVIEQRYPAAGDPNVNIKLGIIEIIPRLFANNPKVGAMAVVPPPEVQWVDLGANKDIYLARVDWLPDAKRLSFQRQSRKQRELELLLFDRRDASQKRLLKETRDTWVDLHHDLHFLKDGKHFLWASDVEGNKQLYLHDMSGKRLRRLTNGQWPMDALLAVDEQNNAVYVSGNGKDPLQKHVFRHGLLRSTKALALSKESGWHDAVFATDTSIFVATHSDPATPPRVRLFDRQGQLISTLEANAVDATHPYAKHLEWHQLPEYGVLQSDDGQDLHYALIKPKHFDAKKQYPAIMRFYGGPGRQFVTRAWTSGINTGATDLLTQYWVQQGYVVFALDNRGTPRRGRSFEHAIYRKMGAPDVADQLVGLNFLREQSFIARDRIGAFGWSYGGYMALMLAGQAGHALNAAAAVAPVTDWALYDTHYTERYMDLPKDNVDGYRHGTVFAHLDALKARLFLIHGMADDNVLFTHSTALMADLQNRGVAFDLMGYPGGKHGLSTPAMRKHVYGAIDEFFARQLKKP